MLAMVVVFFQNFYYRFEMAFIPKKISIGSINKKSLYVMLSDVVCIGFLDAEQIIIRNFLFVGTVSLLYILLKLAYRCMQVNQDLWLNQLLVNDLKKPLV